MLWVVDNFYPNPDEIRERALKLNFNSGRKDKEHGKHVMHPGWRHNTNGDPAWQENRIYLRNRWESITGLKITNYEGQKSNCAFNIGFADKENRFNWVHSDDEQGREAMYACVIYLTPNPPADTGTLLFEYKGSIYDEQVKNRLPTKHYPVIKGKYWDEPSSIDSDFKVHGIVGNRYNRCVIYEGSMLHAPEDAGFGTTLDDARLTQIGFWYGEQR